MHLPPQINKQLACLVANVYQEGSIATNQDQVFIAIVTLNRALHRYKSTAYHHLCNTVFRPHQFSWTRYFQPELQGKYNLTRFREYYHVTNNKQWARAELNAFKAMLLLDTSYSDTKTLYYHDNSIIPPVWTLQMHVKYRDEYFTFYDRGVICLSNIRH